jgi:hypothetical protein
MGAMNLREIFDESSYTSLEGGILVNFGRLFKNNLKIFVYPYVDQKTASSSRSTRWSSIRRCGSCSATSWTGVASCQLTNINHAYLNIYSPDVREQDQREGARSGRSMVPPEVANAIKSRGTVRYS